VDRLRPLLPKLIAPTQSSFIPGRVTSENIIITQELLHTMRKKKGRSGQMAIKIDLEKAYDKISWSFLHSVLLEVNLPQSLMRNQSVACFLSISIPA
jgi:hypothetical protein